MVSAQFCSALREKRAYPFWIKENVRFTDLDALGHASAVRVNEYFNAVRVALFHQAIKNWPLATSLPVMKVSIVQHEKEILFPAVLDVGLVLEAFGHTSVTMAAAVFAEDVCMALARNVFVFIDASTRTAVAPPASIKENFQRLTGIPDHEHYKNIKE